MFLHHRSLVGFLAILISSPALAVNVCGITDVIDLSAFEPLPFGGEVLGVGPEGGQIVGATLDVTFTTSGSFDAANLGVWLVLNLHSGGAAFGFSGVELGWSGQGTFTRHLETDALNGHINSFGNPYSTWFISMANLDPGAGPVSGTFGELVFRLIYAPCPQGDINMDASVNVLDLLAVINGWGACQPEPAECGADLNDDGSVSVPDLLAVINNWQTYCPNCK
jgi:hypothetical protein